MFSPSSLLGLLLLFLCLALLRVVYKLWWEPIRVQRMMAAQGIKGPPYSFLHGSNKEIIRMRKEAMERPMDYYLSHDILPRIQPHIHTWINTYGKPVKDKPSLCIDANYVSLNCYCILSAFFCFPPSAMEVFDIHFEVKLTCFFFP